MESVQECRTCRHWVTTPFNSERGECHFNAPAVVPSPNRDDTVLWAVWPATVATDWCSKWEPKETRRRMVYADPLRSAAVAYLENRGHDPQELTEAEFEDLVEHLRKVSEEEDEEEEEDDDDANDDDDAKWVGTGDCEHCYRDDVDLYDWAGMKICVDCVVLARSGYSF